MKKNYALFFTLFIFACLSYGQRTANYFINGDFESWNNATNIGDWTFESNVNGGGVYSTTTQETSITRDALASTTSIKYDATETAKGLIKPSAGIVLTEPGKYFFGVWLKAGAASDQIKLSLKRTPSGESAVYTSSTYTAADTDWHYVAFAGDFEIGDEIVPRISPIVPSGTVTFYIDDASFGQGLAGESVEWEFLANADRDYTTFFNTQNYGGTNNGVMSLETTEVHSGNYALKLVTNADASNTKRAVIVFKSSASLGIRYSHPANTERDYVGFVWVMSTTASTVRFNLKVGSGNNVSSAYNLTPNVWTRIGSDIVSLSDTDLATDIYPLLQFSSPSTTNYIDDFYLDWGAMGTLSANVVEGTNTTIYPNPVQDVLHIHTQERVKRVAVYNVLGALVASQTNTLSLNTASLANGVYILKIQFESGKTQQEKFVKE